MTTPVAVLDQSGTGQYSQFTETSGGASIPTSYIDFPWAAYPGLTGIASDPNPMLVFSVYTYPYPWAQPISASFGGNACIIGPYAYNSPYSGQPQRTLQIFLLPVTSSMTFAVSPGGSNYVRFSITYPGSVNVGNFAMCGEMLAFTNVDPVGTALFASTNTEIDKGTGGSPTVWALTGSVTGNAGDCLFCGSCSYDWSAGTQGVGAYQNIFAPAGYSQSTGGSSASGIWLVSAYRTLTVNSTDTLTWEATGSFVNQLDGFVQFVLKAAGPTIPTIGGIEGKFVGAKVFKPIELSNLAGAIPRIYPVLDDSVVRIKP